MQCENMLSESVRCDGEITSKLTGKYCSKCFFAKRNAQQSASNTTNTTNTNQTLIKETLIKETKEEPLVKLGESGKIKSVNKFCDVCKTHAEHKQIEGKWMCCHCDPQLLEEHPTHLPSVTKQNNIENGKKYCQSCIERGYNPPNIASREWKEGYYICEECFRPLINNLAGIPDMNVEIVVGKVKLDSPALNQVYEVLGIPESLRFDNSESVVKSYEDLFTHRATAIVNLNMEQLKEMIEFRTTLLSMIKIDMQPIQQMIDKLKHEERTKANLVSIETGRKQASKGSSKVKMSEEEKQAKVMGMSLEQYRAMAMAAKQMKFNKIVGKE